MVEHETHYHDDDGVCPGCVSDGYISGLEAGIEHVMGLINVRADRAEQEGFYLRDFQDLLGDTFSQEFFPINLQGERVK